MDPSLHETLRNAGVKDSVISALEDEELDAVDILKNTSDELLKACGIKGGQVVRIRNALVSMGTHVDVAKDKVPTIGDGSPEATSTPVIDNDEVEFDLSTSVSRTLSRRLLDSSSTVPSTCNSSSCETLSSGSLQPSPGFVIKETAQKRMMWINDYKLPQAFSPKVNEALNAGKLFGTLRDEFTRDICNSIKVHTLFPNRDEKQRVASMIIEKYPFLGDTLGAGPGSWFKAITYRFKNMRRQKPSEITKPRDSSTVKKDKVEPLTPKIKKRKLDFPSMAEGETEETCEEHKKTMAVEMTKSKKKYSLIKDLMNLTYPYRRQTFLKEAKSLGDILLEYPALQLVSEVKAEFGRLLSDHQAVRNMTDKYNGIETKVLEWAATSTNRNVKHHVSQMQTMLLEQPNKKEDIASTTVALIIQSRLKEKTLQEDLFIKICTDDDSIDSEVEKAIYPRIIASGDLGTLDPIYIAVEGQVFLNFSKKTIPVSMVVAMLVATFYVLNMEYTPGVVNVFAFLELALMGNQAEGKKRISVQKFVNEQGLDSWN